MKLIIQIPCYNEETTLPSTIRDLPKKINGIDHIEYLIIDDGSTDKTVAVASKLGIHHIIKNNFNKGLAYSFKKGISHCIEKGADIIVNTDADNQYSGHDIPKLINPILNKEADMVIGARPIMSHKEFSLLKKALQIIGSKVVRMVSGVKVDDAPSGFRAYSKETALKINVFSSYTYTLETIIQAGQLGLMVKSIPINVNPKLRESRLFKNSFIYIKRSIVTIIRIFIVYKPLKFFIPLSLLFIFIGLIPFVRYLILFISNTSGMHLQSLILGSVLSILGLFILTLGIIADLISINRRILEENKLELLRLNYLKNNKKNL